MLITPQTLRTTILKVGSYRNSAGMGPLGPIFNYAGGPVLRDHAGNIGNMASRHTHFMIPANHRVSYNVSPSPGGGNVVNFEAAKGWKEAVYLPFLSNNISSAVIDNSVNRFFTDNLSGCSIFIDRFNDGRFVVYHANSMSMSPAPGHDPDYERHGAQAIMSQYRTNANAAQYAGAVNVASLFKSDYNAAAARQYRLQRFVGGAPNFDGGTTVVGFRTGAGWEFWFQTWGRVDGGAMGVFEARRFY